MGGNVCSQSIARLSSDILAKLRDQQPCGDVFNHT